MFEKNWITIEPMKSGCRYIHSALGITFVCFVKSDGKWLEGLRFTINYPLARLILKDQFLKPQVEDGKDGN